MISVMLSLVVKVTLILALGLGLTAVLSRSPAAFRHVILLGTLVSALLLPILIVVAPRWNVSVLEPNVGELSRANSSGVGQNIRSPGSLSEITAAPTPRGRGATRNESTSSDQLETSERSVFANLDLFTLLVIVWLLGSLGVLGWLALGHLRLRSLAHKSWPLDSADWVVGLREERERAGVEKSVRVLCNPIVSTPLTWGSFDPVVMLPEDALEWSDEHRRIVLRHELAHVARSDALAQFVAGVACAIYWFQPLVWIAERKLRAECERACDDRVVTSGTPAPVYAAHLLEVARSARSFGGPGFLSVAMARPSQLEGRLLAVLNESRSRDSVPRRTRWLMLISMVAVALGVSAFRPVHRDAEASEPPIVAKGTTVLEQLPVVVTAVAVATVPATISRKADSTFDRSIDAQNGGTLTLDFRRSGATVTITGWDRPQVLVKARLGGRNWRETETTLEAVDGGVLLRNAYIGRSRNTSFSHSFDIRVPRNFNVRLSSAGGGISVFGVNGSFTGATGGGEIQFEKASGEVDLRTGGGDINVTNSSLSGSVRTGGGAVRIDSSGRGLVGRSGSGDVAYTNSRTGAADGSGRTSVDNGGIPRSGGTTTFLIDDHPDSVVHFGESGIQRHRSGGDITLGAAPNGARVTTGGGAIRIGPSAGEVFATTGGGSIQIGPASGSVIASTGAGNITLAFWGSGLHAADVASGLGHVELVLPDNINAELVLETAYTNNLARKTRIESDWPLTITETDRWDASVGTPRKYVRARKILGTGGGVIRVRTVNGNVIIRNAGSL